MRETQYVGLTEAASNWVKKSRRSSTYDMTRGMFDEPIKGKIYHMPPPGFNKEFIAKEVVQVAPWSSGPVILTHLKMSLIQASGQKLDLGYYYSWYLDPECTVEFNQKFGCYNI